MLLERGCDVPVIPLVIPHKQFCTTGTYSTDDPSDVSSENGLGWHLLDRCAATRNRLRSRTPPRLLAARPSRWGGHVASGLIIRLIIQTIRQDPSGSVWTDEASNVSRPDPSGADQIDAEHQATDLAVGGSNPSRRAKCAGQRYYSKGSRRPPESGLIIHCRDAVTVDAPKAVGWNALGLQRSPAQGTSP